MSINDLKIVLHKLMLEKIGSSIFDASFGKELCYLIEEEQRMKDDKTNKVIEALGDNVLTVCIEECAELIQAITKYKRYVSTPDGKVHKHYYDRDTRECYMNLHEEIADVLEMIDWLVKYMEFDTKMIDTLRTLKKARAWDRLQEGELK